MEVAKMENKITQATTLLIDKQDFDDLKENVRLLEMKCSSLNYHIDLLEADLDWLGEKYEEYDNNILCRTIIRIKHLVQQVVKWVKFKLNEKRRNENDN